MVRMEGIRKRAFDVWVKKEQYETQTCARVSKLGGTRQTNTLTRLSSSVQTRRAQSLIGLGSSFSGARFTSRPSHQHFLYTAKSVCSSASDQDVEQKTYRGFPPEQEELLCCRHLVVVNRDLRLARARRMVDTRLEENQRDG
jgi:hypothetical protein